MKTLFTISMLLFSVSLFATGNDNDGMGPDNPITGTTGTSTVGTNTGSYSTYTSDLADLNKTTSPAIELSTDGYKTEFKDHKLSTTKETTTKEDAALLSNEMESMIKDCKTKMFATTADYDTKNTCFLNKTKAISNDKHRFIFSTIIALCDALYSGVKTGNKNTDTYAIQSKYLCHRNVLRAVLKTKKGLVIGWGNKEKNTPSPAKLDGTAINSDTDTPTGTSSCTETSTTTTTNPN